MQCYHRILALPGWFGFLLCFLLPLFTTSEIFAPACKADTPEWNDITVVFASGKEYENAKIGIISGNHQSVMVETGNFKRAIPISEISFIYDRNGKDIIDIVYRRLAEPEKSESDGPELNRPDQIPRYQQIYLDPHKPKKWKYANRYRIGLSLGSGYSASLGEWFDAYTDGHAFAIKANVVIRSGAYIGATYRYQRLGLKEDTYYANGAALNFDAHLNEYFFLVGFYRETTHFSSPLFFAELGIGAIDHILELEATFEDNVDSSKDNDTKLGGMCTAGVIIPISAIVGICVEGNLRIVMNSSQHETYEYIDNSNSSSPGTLLGINMNLVFLLGR